MVEQKPEELRVGGSIPSLGTISNQIQFSSSPLSLRIIRVA